MKSSSYKFFQQLEITVTDITGTVSDIQCFHGIGDVLSNFYFELFLLLDDETKKLI